MDHANVLKIIGHCVEEAPFLTVLEPCSLVSSAFISVELLAIF